MDLGVILIVLCVGVAIVIVFPSLVKMVLRRRFLHEMKCCGSVFLTFDDGPNPRITPLLLDTLEEGEAKATFFVKGRNVEASPDLAEEILARGHAIGEHSYSHTHAWKSLPYKTAADLWAGGRVLDSLNIERAGRLFRPPFGKLNVAGLFYIWWMRRKTCFWSVDPHDYRTRSGAAVASRVAEHLTPGAVVLLHDGPLNLEEGSERPVVVEAVKRILEEGRRRGLVFDCLSTGRCLNGRTPACLGPVRRIGSRLHAGRDTRQVLPVQHVKKATSTAPKGQGVNGND